MGEKIFPGKEAIAINQVEKERIQRKERMINLANELSESRESFVFCGFTEKGLAGLEAADKEYPGLATPLFAISIMLKRDGMKVALGNDPRSGNVYILPYKSNDIESDGILPKHFEINEMMNPKLRELIMLSRQA